MPEEMMSRPSISDGYVCRRAAEIIFPKVWGWMGRENSGCKQEDVMRDLTKIASAHRNGFELAKDLERRGWMVDDLLVDILADTWVQDAIDELTDQWVRCLNIRPQFAVGDRVVPTAGHRRGEEGTVARVDERLARYGVHFDDMEKNSWRTFDFEAIGAVATIAAAVRR
ncbi:MAG: hypothetical protein ACLGPM_07845 [Acidobacteriota bacterium]